MNSALKHTIIAMATAALSMTAACKSDDGPEASEATTGAKETAGPITESELATYERLYRDGWLFRELWKVRNVRSFWRPCSITTGTATQRPPSWASTGLRFTRR